jgi:N utilization substance protein A
MLYVKAIAGTTADEDDVELTNFQMKKSAEVVKILQELWLDTAKSILKQDVEDLVRTDLEGNDSTENEGV